MSGHVLIIDALSNRRIQLHAQLDTVSYDVDLAETQKDALSSINRTVPDVIFIANDLPGLNLPGFCKSLRANTKTQLVSIIVAVPHENHSARVSALIAGASDVVDYSISRSELHARLRNLTRVRQSAEEMHACTSSTRSLGFGEPHQTFDRPNRAVLIGPADAGQPVTYANTLGAEFETNVVTLEKARRGLEVDADVVLLFEGHEPDQSRELLGMLHSHSKSRHAAILFVSSHPVANRSSPLDLGASDHVRDTVSDTELVLRCTRLAEQKHIEDQARRELNSLGQKAYTDALTGLNNRTFADAFLRKQDRMLADFPCSRSVIMVDIDHFKLINDNHGHAAGDTILVHIAGILKSHLREGDLLARYGGEEFLISLVNVTEKEAKSVANRLREHVSQNPKALEDGTHVRATISLGLAHAPRSCSHSSHYLYRAADDALYRAKDKGRNRLQIANLDEGVPPRQPTPDLPKANSV